MSDVWPLVGRSAELERIGVLLSGSQRRGVALVGPAGVGKTRIGDEALALARRSGFATIRLLASRAASSLPLGAFAPALPPGFATGEPAELLQRAQEALVQSVGSGPLFVLADDAHLLDEPSAGLLRQLVLTDAAFLLTTTRAGASVSDALVSLWKDDYLERLDIEPLGPTEVARLLATVLGGAVDPVLSAELSSRSGGNVLFLRELLAHGIAIGSVVSEGGVHRLRGRLDASDRLLELIDARVEDLDAAERTALEYTALAEPLHLDQLSDLIAADAVETLARRQLVRVEGTATPIVRLAHPLYGDAVRAAMSPLRHRHLLGQLADATAAGTEPTPDDLLRVAVWRLDSGTPPAPEILLPAAQRAHELGDAALTERLAAIAADRIGGFTANLLLGQAQAARGRGNDAEATWDRLGRTGLRDDERVLLTTHRFMNLIGVKGTAEAALAMVAEQEELLTDEAARQAVKAPIIGILGSLGYWAAVRRHGNEFAADLAGVPRFVALLAAVMADVMAGRFDRALAVLDEQLNQPTELNAAAGFLRFGFAQARAEALCYAGALAQAETTAVHVYERTVEAGDLRAQAWLATVVARTVLWQGRPATAARWARIAHAASSELGHANTLSHELCELVQALALTGEVEAAEEAFHRFTTWPSEGNTYRRCMLTARAWLAVTRGRLEAARADLLEAAAIVHDEGDYGIECILLHDVARLGWPADVAPRLAELAVVVDGPLAGARCEHSAALVRGDAAALDAVAARFAANHAHLLAAEAASDAAVAWRRAGDPRRATASARAAASHHERCEGARTPALASLTARSDLTASARRIATLAAGGLSNREIATELTLSVRTVENTLARVYRTLGIASRAGLAAALKGSTPPEDG